MKRREFIRLATGAAAGLPLVAHAQQQISVIGFLISVSLDTYADRVAAFRQGLKDGGFVDGQNVAIEYRSAEGDLERLPALARDLVARRVAVIVAVGTS